MYSLDLVKPLLDRQNVSVSMKDNPFCMEWDVRNGPLSSLCVELQLTEEERESMELTEEELALVAGGLPHPFMMDDRQAAALFRERVRR